LTWLGKEEGGFPVAAGLTLGGALVGGALLVVLVRRRRSRAGTPAKEAW
jgi:LPXTG-motif cell wall-anchored protein